MLRCTITRRRHKRLCIETNACIILYYIYCGFNLSNDICPCDDILMENIKKQKLLEKLGAITF